MARKNLLKGLMSPPENTDPPSVQTGRPRYAKGAIGAVSQSIADLKSRAVAEIDPDLIEAGGLEDRLGEDAEGHEALMRSIRDHGQQVPVLVRPHPRTEGRYQIVFGRRRLRALRALGQPVKAMVRDLDDEAALLAQGQENSARRDLSFIERVNFARQLEEAGYARSVICDALHIDKTLVSRMLSVAERVPRALIEAIGPAPSVGRTRWLKLAEALEAAGADRLADLLESPIAGAGSDARFDTALAHLTGPARRPPEPAQSPLLGAEGEPLGHVRHGRQKAVLTLQKDAEDGFADWLIEALPDLHRKWRKRR